MVIKPQGCCVSSRLLAPRHTPNGNLETHIWIPPTRACHSEGMCCCGVRRLSGYRNLLGVCSWALLFFRKPTPLHSLVRVVSIYTHTKAKGWCPGPFRGQECPWALSSHAQALGSIYLLRARKATAVCLAGSEPHQQLCLGRSHCRPHPL